MVKYGFFKIERDKDGVSFLEVGTAWYEPGKGAMLETKDERLAELFRKPLQMNVGEVFPHTISPSEERFVKEAASELQSEGYLGRPMQEEGPFNPSAEDLALQGLDEHSYADLDTKSRIYFEKKALLYRQAKDKTLVAELLNAMAEEMADKKALIDVLEERNPRGAQAVLSIVAGFKKSGMSSIRDYYRTYHPGKADKIFSGL